MLLTIKGDFMNQPDIRPISPDEYQLQMPYIYTWRDAGILNRITVPAGYINDGASVPRLLWSIVRPDGLIRAGALIHDWLCAHAGHIPVDSHQILRNEEWIPAGKIWARAEGDAMFRRINIEAKMSGWKVHATYIAIRACGWVGWKDRGDEVAARIKEQRISNR
jgi:hypothetical protein